MIYIITMIVLILFILKFDLKGKVNTPQYNKMYYVVMAWFIVVSGFSYNVGSDIPIYMRLYDEISWTNIDSFRDLFDSSSHQMPGWTLLMLCCKSISSDFFVLKLSIAIFSNSVIFWFIKNNSKYPFITVLFYGIALYLNLNFNALRQLISLSIFLLGYQHLVEKKWIKYYIIILLAYLFHSSAIVCVLFPIFTQLRLNKKKILYISLLIIVTSIILLVSQIGNSIGNLLFVYSNSFAEDMSEYINMYFSESNNMGLNIVGVMRVVISLISASLITIFSYKPKENDLLVKMSMLYIVFLSLNFSVGVVFTRLSYYVQFFYLCILPSGVVYISKIVSSKKFVTILIYVFLASEPINNLLNINKSSGHPLIVQYYPYYSIFNPKIDPVRDATFGSYRK